MRFHITTAVALVLALPATAQQNPAHPAPAAAPAQHGPRWSYAGADGPDAWGGLDPAFAACAAGQQESPIDLAGAVTAELGPLDLDWRPGPGRVFDTGHAIQVEAAPGSTMTLGGHDYRLLQFHVHQPSEHLLNGRRFPLEIHFVHAGADGVLGVVGVFAETGEVSPALQSVLGAIETEAELPTLDPSAYLPDARAFFRYEGSLTTPPCSETVDWVVLATPITVSENQVQAFARLHPGNTRPVQPLNRRFLLHSGD